MGSSGTAANRWWALGGVLFVVLTIVAVVGLGGNTPSPGDAADKIRTYYTDHKARQFIAVFVLAASVPFFLFYAALLANTFTEGSRSIWRITLLVGSGMMAIAWVSVAFLHFALTDGVDQKASDGALEALTMLDGDNWLLFNSAVGVFMLGAAGTLLSARTSAGYRRLGWVALILGIALFIPFADFFALLVSGLWIITTSIMLARATRATQEPVTRPVAST
jgi:hypothetical protein